MKEILQKKLSFLVQGEFLYKIALNLNLDTFIKYNKQKNSYRL